MQGRKTIQGRGADLLNHFAAKSPPVFSLDEAADQLAQSPAATRDLLWRLVEKGWVVRHRSGVYEVAPIWSTPEAPYRPNRFAAIGSWLHGDHYIGFRSAMEHHDWLTHPVLDQVWVAVPRPRRTPKSSVDRVRWVVVREDRFKWGIVRPWVEGLRFSVSDPERTILDCLHLPRHAGGITEIAAALRRAWPSLSTTRLLDYVARYDLDSVRQRLGVLVETLDLPDANGVIEHLRPSTKRLGVVDLDPSLPLGGEIDSRWRVRMNIERGELGEAGTT